MWNALKLPASSFLSLPLLDKPKAISPGITSKKLYWNKNGNFKQKFTYPVASFHVKLSVAL